MPDARRTAAFTDPRIEMAHGAGGKASRRLVEGLFAPLFGDPLPMSLDDAALLEIDGIRLALTADSFVVRPGTAGPPQGRTRLSRLAAEWLRRQQPELLASERTQWELAAPAAFAGLARTVLSGNGQVFHSAGVPQDR